MFIYVTQSVIHVTIADEILLVCAIETVLLKIHGPDNRMLPHTYITTH